MAEKLPEWAEAAAEFLSQNLPSALDRDGWNDGALTAYQIGCTALVALGRAEAREWGAVPRKQPACPEVLPRWDDICISVLWLANQRNLIAFRLPDGSTPPRRIGNNICIVQDAPPPPVPNIVGNHGLGMAYGKPEVIVALERLNLVSEGHWTAASEFILWRTQPANWSLDFAKDKRFAAAADHAVKAIPSEIETRIKDLVEIRDEQIADLIELHSVEIEKQRSKYGPKARLDTVPTRERAERSLEHSQINQIDSLFFQRWRIEDGWLSNIEARAALNIFHDSLAIAMRKAVVQQLHPDRSRFFV